MKKIFLFFLFVPALLCAEPISSYLAQQVAHNFINYVIETPIAPASSAPRKQRHLVQQNTQYVHSPYYIFNSEDGEGFVIVSGDNCATPILGYSNEGYIDTENMPIQLTELLEAYSDEIQFATNNNMQANDSIASLWSEYLRAPQSLTTTTVVAALISTLWDQYPYYNVKCPSDPSLSPLGGHPTTGCVATAMAQIMKYWGYPAKGTGHKSYPSERYGTLSANFANTQYDWSNMPLKLTSSSSSIQVNAVATLMYHCGVAVSMNYNDDNHGSSGASVVDYGGGRASAETALKNYFGYSSSLQSKSLTSTSALSTWKNMLKNELDNSRPVLYRGQGNVGGHAFVCDGYDSNDCFHFNWGWGGAANGYFSLTALTPSNYSFTDGQKAVIGIRPADGSGPTKTYDLYMNTDLSTSLSTYSFGNNLSFSARVENNGTGTFVGFLKVAVFTESGEFVAWSKESYNFTLNAGQNTVSKTYTFDGGIPFIPGKYRAFMYYQDADENDSKLVKTDEGIFLTEYNNIAFSIQTTSELQLTSNFNVDDIYGSFTIGSRIRIDVNVKNTSSTIFKGKIRLCLYNSDGSLAQVIDELDYSTGIAANKTQSLSYMGIIDVKPGSYKLALTYKKTSQSSWCYMACTSTYPNPIYVTIQAPTIYADDFENNNTQSTASNLNWIIDPEMEDFGTDRVSLHNDSDIDYYKLIFNKHNNYKVKIVLCDFYNQCGWHYVNADAEYAYSMGGTYSEYFKNTKTISFNGPTTLYIRVRQYGLNGIGFYELSGDITETISDAIDEIVVGQPYSKVLRDGHLYILRDGNLFTATGAKVK